MCVSDTEVVLTIYFTVADATVRDPMIATPSRSYYSLSKFLFSLLVCISMLLNNDDDNDDGVLNK